jgi:circadian clock protein KaiA
VRGDRYSVTQVDSATELVDFIEENKESIDCIIALNDSSLLPIFNQLYEQGTLLPVIIVDESELALNPEKATYLYHSSEIRIPIRELDDIAQKIDQAITQFLHLGPSCPLSEKPIFPKEKIQGEELPSFLLLQQRRLAEKLKERLGYLGVYYKRNPQYFYRNLSQSGKKEFLNQLSLEYRQMILNYFSQDEQINQTIDQFVNRAFFADISVSKILEIHMELMDEFAQQLKLEGRSEEILLDYRLALIDIIAHLGEMYRRSIPREDIPLELLFHLD